MSKYNHNQSYILPVGYVMIKINWMRYGDDWTTSTFDRYTDLKEWVTNLGLDVNRSFHWKDPGRYYPSHIVLDEATAIIFKLTHE
jgi:hypothetical protein